MEKVINLAKYSLVSYRSPSVAVNQPAEIAVESFSGRFMGVHSCVHSASTCGRGQSETKFYLIGDMP